MARDPRLAMMNRAMRRYRAGRISRRQLMGMFGALGLTTAAAPWLLGRGAAAKTAPTGGHAHFAMAQEEAPPAATPVLGQQPDGSTVWKVVAGGGGTEEELIDLLAFYPTEITVNAGDAVYWENRGFHNVHFLSGAPLPPLIVPEMAMADMASPATDMASPAAGAPRLLFNPEIAIPTGGPTYDGTGVYNSGFPDPSAPPPMLTFTTAGSYDYYCTIHGEVMEGRVIVQEAGGAAPMDQTAVDQLGTDEMTADLETARALAAQEGGTPMAGGATAEVLVGLSGDPFSIDAFFPRQLTVSAGDTVRFVNPTTDPPVPHTVTFVSGGAAPEFVLVEPSAAGPPLFVVNPELTGPAGGATYSGTGYFNSGLLAADAGMTEYSLSFDTAGTYRYYCAIHGDPEGGMIGDIVVEAAG